MISPSKVQTKKKTQTSKVWYGNPQVELIEGNITYSRIKFLMNKNFEHEYNESELESIKQHIWEMNMNNNLIKTSELLCINVPNKISVNEFLNTISIYLSYINIVRVFKSPIPNFYFVYMNLKNIEYSNILYNTFNYAKVNPIEKEYFIFVEVKEVKFDEFFFNELSYKNSKRLHGIKVLVSPSSKSLNGIENKIIKANKFDLNEIISIEKNKLEMNEEDLKKFSAKEEEREDVFNASHPESFRNSYNNSLYTRISSKSEINLCPICLDQIEINDFSMNSLTSANGIIHVLCGHIVHIECSLKLDDDKCPMCRYNLSPTNVSSCSLCSCENDLWMCLICGSINCGVEGISNNHRREHYLSTGHIYAKELGVSHNVTFDFTRNAPLNILIQNSFRNFNNNNTEILTNQNGNFFNNNEIDNICQTNTNTDSLYFKDPKEKVQFIVSEYNSIISSQLENQRLYYLNYMRKIDERFKEEEVKIDGDFSKLKEDYEELVIECNLRNEKKTQIMEAVKTKEIELKGVQSELQKTEEEYKNLIETKEKFEENKRANQKVYFENLIIVETEIEELQNQIKDLNIHINTLNLIGNKSNSSSNEISGASIEFVANTRINKKSKSHKKK